MVETMPNKEYLTAPPDVSFFHKCAFICVDLQQNGDVAETEPNYLTEAQMPDLWKQMGFAVDDVNDAIRYAVTNCMPNAVRVTAACRRFGMPMIFIHWGSRYPDLADIDPEVRGELYYGPGSERNAYTPESHVRRSRRLKCSVGRICDGENGAGFLPRHTAGLHASQPRREEPDPHWRTYGCLPWQDLEIRHEPRLPNAVRRGCNEQRLRIQPHRKDPGVRIRLHPGDRGVGVPYRRNCVKNGIAGNDSEVGG